MTKKAITLLCFVLGVHFAYAQTLTLRNSATGEPIIGATLSAKSEVFTVTNARGKADVSAFVNTEKIEIRSLGFKTEELSYSDFENQDFIIFLKPTNLSLDEVVISGTRWRQTSANIPSKIVSISANEVALQNPQTAADMLALSGKVFVQKSQQGGGSPMIRGFATNRLLYTVDGVRMNNAIFRGGNIQNVINLDPFATERTEVLFGPGSVIYGSDAIGGVMSFKTLTPQFTIRDEPLISGKATTRLSSANNEKTAHFDVNVGWKKWAFVSSFSNWSYDHLRQGSNGPTDYLKPYFVRRIDSVDRLIWQSDELLQIPTGYRQFNTMQKLRFKPSEKLDLQYGFHYSQTSSYGRYDRHNRMRNELPRYATWNYGPQKWMMHNLSLNYFAENAVFDEMALRFAFQNFEESRIERSFNSNEKSIQSEQVDAISVNLDFEKHMGIRSTLYYGFEFVQNNVFSKGEIENINTNRVNSGPSRYPQSSWQSIAVYVNDEFKATEKLTFQGGVRYNQFILDAQFDTTFYPLPFTVSNTNNGALTGSIGGVYRPTASTVIKASLGTAFRAPNVDDIGKVFDSEPGTVTVPNPNLKAEYAQNLDIGFAKVVANKLKVDITGYYTQLNNAIVRRDYNLNGTDSILYFGELSKVQALQNAAHAQVYGVQFGFEWQLPAGFSLSSDLNWQRGEEELNDGSLSPSRHAAPFFGVGRINYKQKKLSMQVYTLFQGERSFNELSVDERNKDEIYAKDANDNNYAPAWYTLNFKAQYLLNNTFIINAGVENITDQRYRPYSSGLSGAGRNFIISVTARF